MELRELDILRRIGKAKVKIKELTEKLNQLLEKHKDLDEHFSYALKSRLHYIESLSMYYKNVKKMPMVNERFKHSVFKVSPDGYKALTATQKKKYKITYKLFKNIDNQVENIRDSMGSLLEEIDNYRQQIHYLEIDLKNNTGLLDRIKNPDKYRNTPYKKSEDPFEDDIPF